MYVCAYVCARACVCVCVCTIACAQCGLGQWGEEERKDWGAHLLTSTCLIFTCQIAKPRTSAPQEGGGGGHAQVQPPTLPHAASSLYR